MTGTKYYLKLSDEKDLDILSENWLVGETTRDCKFFVTKKWDFIMLIIHSTILQPLYIIVSKNNKLISWESFFHIISTHKIIKEANDENEIVSNR